MNAHAHPRTFLAAGLVACLAGPAFALNHSGTQTGTWRAEDSPHVLTGDVFVPAGQGLVLEPGCIVFVEPGVSLEVEGSLVAEGTPQRVIHFSSRELQPHPGDWEGIRLHPGSVAWLGDVRVLHAVEGVVVEDGAGFDADGLTVADSLGDGVVIGPGALASLQRCVLERNGGAGLVVEGGTPAVVDCELRLNDHAMRMSVNAFPLLHGVTATWNRELDGIRLDTTEAVTGFGSWHGNVLPYVVPDGETLRVEGGAKLGLDGGLILKLGRGAGIEVAGDLSASLGDGGGPLFTSLHDDEAGGDTNRDDSRTRPAKGDWNGIDVLDGGSVTFGSVELRLADDGLDVFPGGRAVLNDCELHSNQGRGLGVGSGATAVVEGSSFHDNDTGVQIADTSGVALGLIAGNGPTGGGNSFHCNLAFDIQNDSAFILEAHRNFWGTTPPDAGRFLGSVDTGEFLIAAPERVLARSCMELRRVGMETLRFDWSELSSCASYQLASAEDPVGPFGAFTPPTTAESHFEPQGARVEGRPVRYFRLLTELGSLPE